MYTLKKYGADWCSHCKAQDNEFKKSPLQCSVENYDVEELEDKVIEELKIRSLPLMILYKDDIELKRWTGHVTSSEVNNLIEL